MAGVPCLVSTGSPSPFVIGGKSSEFVGCDAFVHGAIDGIEYVKEGNVRSIRRVDLDGPRQVWALEHHAR